jgi:hypothetical protein
MPPLNKHHKMQISLPLLHPLWNPTLARRYAALMGRFEERGLI